MPCPPGAALAGLGVVMVAVVAAYASGLDGAFVVDARALVLENPHVQAASAANVRYLLTHDYWQPLASGGLYRPLTTLSFLVDWAVLGHGDRPFGYHVTNLVLHLGCVTLVWAVAWACTARAWAAVMAAGLFGLHPLATEAVANIAGRADLLAAGGVLSALFARIAVDGTRGRRRIAWRTAMVLAAAAACFAKESGAVVLALVLSWDLLAPRPGGSRRPGLDVGLVALAVVAALLVRVAVLGGSLPGQTAPGLDNPILDAGFLLGRLTALRVLGRQLGLLLWPHPLSADYSADAIPVSSWPPAGWGDHAALALPWAILALVVGVARWRDRPPGLPVALVWLGLALLPTANLLVLTGSILAERFLYLPLAPFAVAVAACAERLARRQPALVTGVVASLLLAAAVRTHARTREWRDEQSVWGSAVRVVPRSAKAQRAWAAALFAADPRRVSEAIAGAQRAIAIRPGYLDALVDLGGYYVVDGDRLAAAGDPAAARARWAQAIGVLERADGLPGTADSLLLSNNLSLAYVRAERFGDAVAAYDRSRRLDPGNPARHVDLSAVLCVTGRWEEGAVALFQALALAPDHADAAARLVEVYRVFAPDGGAVEDGRLVAEHPVVRAHRCRAAAALATALERAGDSARAERVRAGATASCP